MYPIFISPIAYERIEASKQFTLDLIDCFERYGEVIDWAANPEAAVTLKKAVAEYNFGKGMGEGQPAGQRRRQATRRSPRVPAAALSAR